MSYKQIKRILDIIFAGLGILVSFPLLCIVAVCIKLDSSGPIVFKQLRLGVRGKHFLMYKLRSMYYGSDQGEVYVKQGDARVTRIGSILRKTSIDELPQLVNVLKGDMSIVGPRPVLPYHPWPYDAYTEEQKKIFEVRPGITGWAQVNGRKELIFEKRMECNLEYIRKMSFLLDVKIVLQTIIKVFRMEGTFSMGKP